MDFWAAPIFSLFSLRFYRQQMHASLGKGFLYLLYLSLLFSMALSLVAAFSLMPQSDGFMEWFRGELPSITVTKDGLSMDRPSPYSITHPQAGPLVTFDLSKTEVSHEDMGGFPIFVTSKKIYASQRPGDLRVIDLMENINRAEAPQSLTLTSDMVGRFYTALKPWVIFFIFLAAWIFYFVLYLLSGLLNSLIGLLINLFRKTKLRYGQIFNLSLYALTGPALIGFLGFLIPVVRQVTLGLWGGLAATCLYLVLAVKLTEEKGESVPST